MCLAEAKAKKLDPIKQCLKIWTNYQIESINDGFIIVFPYRYWLDGDGMSIVLLLEDDMDTLILQDDDFCIHNSICLMPEERNNVLAIAKKCRLDCFYESDEHATPEFRAKISPLSFCLNSNIERLIDKIEEFLNKLIVFNWKAYEEIDIRHSFVD